MEKREFATQEALCEIKYREAGTCYHVCSREDHPVLFHDREEFVSAMNIVAFAALLSPDVVLYTFQIMSNHFHFVLSGDSDRIEAFLRLIRVKLSADLLPVHAGNDAKTLQFNIIPINSLDNLRNVIAYTNRNGFVVTPYHSPFSYPWGANRYFFNPEAMLRFRESGIPITYAQKRELFHSNRLSKEKKTILLDGYVCPACYCRITEAEGFFRSCHHYFQSISRNVESAKDIAKSIGERIFYTDDELYITVRQICSQKYSVQSVAMLTSAQKIELATMLHYDYNATNKQIARLLKLAIDVVSQLFPKSV